MQFRFSSERDLLEAISAYYGVIEDADLIQSMLAVSEFADPPRDVAKLRVTLGVSALRLLSLQRTADPLPHTAHRTIQCNRCARLLSVAPWSEDFPDWPRFHRCQCGRVIVESPSEAHTVDEDAFRHALDDVIRIHGAPCLIR